MWERICPFSTLWVKKVASRFKTMGEVRERANGMHTLTSSRRSRVWFCRRKSVNAATGTTIGPSSLNLVNPAANFNGQSKLFLTDRYLKFGSRSLNWSAGAEPWDGEFSTQRSSQTSSSRFGKSRSKCSWNARQPAMRTVRLRTWFRWSEMRAMAPVKFRRSVRSSGRKTQWGKCK